MFWFCDLTFVLLTVPADAALSANFRGSDFSSQVIDKILESEVIPVGTCWKHVTQSANLCFTAGDFLFLYPTEGGLLAS